MADRVVLVPGDQIRVTRPLIQALIEAVNQQEDRVVVDLCDRDDSGEVHLVVRRALL